eukprot:scaffold485336_cov50-Prasinocladus_malaysianus.AAC.1
MRRSRDDSLAWTALQLYLVLLFLEPKCINTTKQKTEDGIRRKLPSIVVVYRISLINSIGFQLALTALSNSSISNFNASRRAYICIGRLALPAGCREVAQNGVSSRKRRNVRSEACTPGGRSTVLPRLSNARKTKRQGLY